MHVLYAPLRLPLSNKKTITIGMNWYRNAHYREMNAIKILYKGVMKNQILNLPKLNKIITHYMLYPKSKRRMDLSNMIAIHDKFFCDALVEFNKIDDDDYKHIIGSTMEFGKVDKNNPRVEIRIQPIK